MWRTVCADYSQKQRERTSGISTECSHALRPMTLTRSRNAAVAICLSRSSYRVTVWSGQKLFYVVAFLFTAAVFHLLFHVISAHHSRRVFFLCRWRWLFVWSSFRLRVWGEACPRARSGRIWTDSVGFWRIWWFWFHSRTSSTNLSFVTIFAASSLSLVRSLSVSIAFSWLRAVL